MNNLINQEHRENMESLETSILNSGHNIELECNHYFSHGTYTRELFIPKGIVLTGAIHRYSSINIITKGKIRAVSDEGSYDIEAPHIFVSGPFVKKAGYALEDTIWINVMPWDKEEDVEMVENHFTIPSYDLLEKEIKELS